MLRDPSLQQPIVYLPAGPCDEGEGPSEYGGHVVGADCVGKRDAQQGNGRRPRGRNALPFRAHWPYLSQLRFTGKPRTCLRIPTRACTRVRACMLRASVSRTPAPVCSSAPW